MIQCIYNKEAIIKLLTKEIIEKTNKITSGQIPADEVKVTAKFFDPTGSFTWFLTELDEDLDYAFGFVVSEFCPDGELGPFSINELQSIKGHLGLGIERDKFWTVATLKEVMDNPSKYYQGVHRLDKL